MTQPYTKSWLSIDDQIARTVDRGMADAADHRDAFEQIGYYRLSGYWYPFRRVATDGSRLDGFYPEATFADVLALYDFDSRLRGAVWHAVVPSSWRSAPRSRMSSAKSTATSISTACCSIPRYRRTSSASSSLS